MSDVLDTRKREKMNNGLDTLEDYLKSIADYLECPSDENYKGIKRALKCVEAEVGNVSDVENIYWRERRYLGRSLDSHLESLKKRDKHTWVEFLQEVRMDSPRVFEIFREVSPFSAEEPEILEVGYSPYGQRLYASNSPEIQKFFRKYFFDRFVEYYRRMGFRENSSSRHFFVFDTKKLDELFETAEMI